MIQKQNYIDVSSNPDNGAKNVSSSGDYFEINYQGISPWGVPEYAKDVSVEIQTSEIWWNIPNLILNSNDKFQLTDTGAGSGTAYSGTVTIEQGLYTLTQLANAIETQLVNDGAASGTISFSSNTATQKVNITANFIGISINFTIANSVRNLIGFDSITLGPEISAPYTWIGNTQAQFNQINHFLLHGDVVDQGIPLNDKYSSILAKVQINVKPGSQILYAVYNPARSSANKLKGSTQTNFKFWLTDDQNRSVNTAGDFWAMECVVRYLMDIKYLK